MAQSIFNFHVGQAPNESFLGGVMQRQIFTQTMGYLGNYPIALVHYWS